MYTVQEFGHVIDETGIASLDHPYPEVRRIRSIPIISRIGSTVVSGHIFILTLIFISPSLTLSQATAQRQPGKNLDDRGDRDDRDDWDFSSAADPVQPR